MGDLEVAVVRQIVTWEMMEQHFEVASGLNLDTRDLFVDNVSIADWETFFRWVEGMGFRTFWQVDSEPVDFEFQSAEDAFEKRTTAFVTCSFLVGCVLIRCAFFHPSQIELDFHASEIDCQQTLNSLTTFMAELGQLLQRRVVVCYSEGEEMEDWILRYEPAGDWFEARVGRVPFALRVPE